MIESETFITQGGVNKVEGKQGRSRPRGNSNRALMRYGGGGDLLASFPRSDPANRLGHPNYARMSLQKIQRTIYHQSG